jgi:hypothetical protein
MLAYADVCWRMLTYADETTHSRMRIHACESVRQHNESERQHTRMQPYSILLIRIRILLLIRMHTHVNTRDRTRLHTYFTTHTYTMYFTTHTYLQLALTHLTTSHVPSIRQHTSANVRMPKDGIGDGNDWRNTYASIRRNTSAYVSIRQHTSA